MFRRAAAFSRARCDSPCGRLPRNAPVSGSISSASKPSSLVHPVSSPHSFLAWGLCPFRTNAGGVAQVSPESGVTRVTPGSQLGHLNGPRKEIPMTHGDISAGEPARTTEPTVQTVAVLGAGGTMPRTRRSGQLGAGELPGTLRRSSKEAQETFTEAYDSAMQAYGAGDQASRVAYTELKKKFEKRADHWIPKDDPGPSTIAG